MQKYTNILNTHYKTNKFTLEFLNEEWCLKLDKYYLNTNTNDLDFVVNLWLKNISLKEFNQIDLNLIRDYIASNDIEFEYQFSSKQLILKNVTNDYLIQNKVLIKQINNTWKYQFVSWKNWLLNKTKNWIILPIDTNWKKQITNSDHYTNYALFDWFKNSKLIIKNNQQWINLNDFSYLFNKNITVSFCLLAQPSGFWFETYFNFVNDDVNSKLNKQSLIQLNNALKIYDASLFNEDCLCYSFSDIIIARIKNYNQKDYKKLLNTLKIALN